MVAKLQSTMAALLATGFIAFAGQVSAAPITIGDNTEVRSYSGTSVTGFFGGASNGDVIGTNFDTNRVDVDFYGHTIDIKFYTQFPGSETISGQTAKFADLFIASTTGDVFDYGVALGYQAANGGIATPGMYATPTLRTSYDVWSGRGGFTYGGKYISLIDGLDKDAPTVVTGGSLLSGWNVSTTTGASGDGGFPVAFDIQLTATDPASIALFNSLAANGFDTFWGTADCSNDAFYFGVPPTEQNIPEPEPASLALFGGGILALGALRKRRALVVA